MVHWEQLCPGGFRFVWEDSLFRPSTDSFLLSSLPRLRPGLRVCDLGCGTGLLALLLLQRQRALQVTGMDIQPAAIALAEQAAEENGLTDHLSFLCADLRQTRQHFVTGSFDLVVCNPPYYPPFSGKIAADSARRTARSETAATLTDICGVAAYLLGRQPLPCAQAGAAGGRDLCAPGRRHGAKAAAVRPEPGGRCSLSFFNRGLPGRKTGAIP